MFKKIKNKIFSTISGIKTEHKDEIELLKRLFYIISMSGLILTSGVVLHGFILDMLKENTNAAEILASSISGIFMLKSLKYAEENETKFYNIIKDIKDKISDKINELRGIEERSYLKVYDISKLK